MSSLEQSKDSGRRKWRNSSTERPRKDGGLRLVQQESLMKEQAMRIERTRQENFFVPIDSNLGVVVGAEEGATESILGNEGRTAQAWLNVRGGLRIFSVHLWHSEVWSSRNEALLEAVLK